MYQSKIDTLMAELYTGKPCSQRYYLRHTLMFLSQHPEYLEGTAIAMCQAMRGTFPSYHGQPVRYQHIYEVLRQCDIYLTSQGIVPGGTMAMLKTLMEKVVS